MKIATITPTRDRPELFEFCKTQLNRQTHQPDVRYYMAFDAEDNKVDLTRRVRQGYELALKDGIDYVFIWEDDDMMVRNYLESVKLNFDFFGYQSSTYYNLRNQTYDTFTHPGRSSLFCTAFRVEALKGYRWPSDDTIFLDIHLWNWATRKSKKKVLLKTNPNTGMKHGLGKVGGKGHKIAMRRHDADLSYLYSRCEDYQFEFYTDLMKRL